MVDPNDELRAKELFDELGVTVVPGQRFLGGFIGNQSGTTEFVEQKVRAWIHCVEKLTKAAESQPQAALAAFTRSLQSEWVYMQRVIPNCADAFTPLRNIINKKFLLTVIGRSISDQEKTLFSLPARIGGLGVRDPVESAQQVYWVSRKCTGKII